MNSMIINLFVSDVKGVMEAHTSFVPYQGVSNVQAAVQ